MIESQFKMSRSNLKLSTFDVQSTHLCFMHIDMLVRELHWFVLFCPCTRENWVQHPIDAYTQLSSTYMHACCKYIVCVNQKLTRTLVCLRHDSDIFNMKMYFIEVMKPNQYHHYNCLTLWSSLTWDKSVPFWHISLAKWTQSYIFTWTNLRNIVWRKYHIFSFPMYEPLGADLLIESHDYKHRSS